MSFNPRAREGRDEHLTPQRTTYYVSIHAPARGATCDDLATFGRRAVSIHAPARGATALLRLEFRQSHVSIHAPARGATTKNRQTQYLLDGFNPRAREGRDDYRNAAGRYGDSFNPRAREGRDRRGGG